MNVLQRCRAYYQHRKDWNNRKIDPWRFEENNKKYYVCCGFFHVKSVVFAFTLIKSLCILCFLIFQFVYRKSAVVTLVSCFAYILILGSYALLMVGVVSKRYTFFIPYFTICILLILSLSLKLFVEVMGTASTKSTLKNDKLSPILFQAAIIMVEIYCVFIVWGTFNYVTDYYMDKDFRLFTRAADQKRQKELDIEEGKERRRARTELLKIRQDEPKRKPTLFEIVARLEERKKSVQQMQVQQQIKDAPSENSSTSGEIK